MQFASVTRERDNSRLLLNPLISWPTRSAVRYLDNYSLSILDSLKGLDGLFELASLVGLIKGLAVFKDKVPDLVIFQIVSSVEATVVGSGQKVFKGIVRELQSCLSKAQQNKCQKGTAFFVASLGALIEVPIPGAIVDATDGDYLGLIILG